MTYVHTTLSLLAFISSFTSASVCTVARTVEEVPHQQLTSRDCLFKMRLQSGKRQPQKRQWSEDTLDPNEIAFVCSKQHVGFRRTTVSIVMSKLTYCKYFEIFKMTVILGISSPGLLYWVEWCVAVQKYLKIKFRVWTSLNAFIYLAIFISYNFRKIMFALFKMFCRRIVVDGDSITVLVLFTKSILPTSHFCNFLM